MKRALRLHFPLMILCDPVQQYQPVVVRALAALPRPEACPPLFMGCVEGSLSGWLQRRKERR